MWRKALVAVVALTGVLAASAAPSMLHEPVMPRNARDGSAARPKHHSWNEQHRRQRARRHESRMRKHHRGAEMSHHRRKAWSPPPIYDATLEFKIPYIGLTEEVRAQVDTPAGMQRLDYYSGLDTYIFKEGSLRTGGNGSDVESFTLTPVNGEMSCYAQTGSPLYNVFPDLSLFKMEPLKHGHHVTHKVTTRAFPHGTECVALTYEHDASTKHSNGNSTATLPDKGGYAGQYTLYISAETWMPVRLTEGGHNVILGGSHPDVYYLDYIQINELTESIDSTVFEPPLGMPCQGGVTPSGGPTMNVFADSAIASEGVTTNSHMNHRSHPLHDLQMLMPGSAADLRRAHYFNEYKRHHGKTYSSPEEHAHRARVFHANLRHIHARNRAGLSYWLSANHLADRTRDEKLAISRGRIAPMSMADVKRDAVTKQPVPGAPTSSPGEACGLHTHMGGDADVKEVDWRTKNMVLPPKDQGTCGSCWSYGVTGTIEGQVAKKTGVLSPLSQQNMMDCTWLYGNMGCGGGVDYQAYAWMMQQNNRQIANEATYGKYLNVNGMCHFAQNTSPPQTVNSLTGQKVVAGATLKACMHVTKEWDGTSQVTTDEAVNALNDALFNVGPLSVSIDATVPDFYYYTGGYYYDETCKNGVNELDHTVLAVGYTTHIERDGSEQRYTLIKNSWSDHWGMGGFIKLSQKGNICGVATVPSYVVLEE